MDGATKSVAAKRKIALPEAIAPDARSCSPATAHPWAGTRCPNPVVAESLLDRLINTSHQVFMNGASYRPNKRPRSVADDKKKTTE